MNALELALAEISQDRGPLSGYRYPLLTLAIAMIVSWVLTPAVRKLAISRGAVDDPNRDDRRIHKEPLPRWGGIAIFVGILVALGTVLPFAYSGQPAFPAYLIGMLLVGAVLVVAGALDDLFQYSAKIQLLLLLGAGVLVQFIYGPIGRVQISTLGFPFSDGYFSLGLFAIPVTAIYIFVITKTMDTIDGVDGLAAGIATISAATLSVIGTYGGQPRVAIIAAAVAGGAMGFLRHNYNPAKIIMGTGGAYILGFTLACLSIVGAMKTAAAVALLLPMFVFGVPVFDAFFVTIKRIRAKVPITQADKRHVHHTLLAQGLNQRQTVLVLYGVALVLSLLLIVMVVQSGK